MPYILDGTKTHTIRAGRAHLDKPGNTLHLYAGLRTKNTRLLGRATCTGVEAIKISTTGRIVIGSHSLSTDEAIDLAWRDGFRLEHRSASLAYMMKYWNGHLPFWGYIIHWKDLVKPEVSEYAAESSRAGV